MSFIRENACRGIHVNDVLRRVGSSPATLQRRFQKWTGHSIYQAIVAVRISRVKQLLTDTELSLREIAPRAGFQYLEHLAAVFKQKTGTTLMKYRKGAGNRVLGYSPWRYGR
jgi:LacI family transcriptional regulator